MLIVISLKNNEFFLSQDVHMSTIKWGQRSSGAIIGAFLQLVFLFFFSGSTTRCLLNSKKCRSLSEGLN